ncbi:MAG: hypothetical protein ACREJB_08470, partial [Planctomycetaceae bacterium]
QAATIEEWTDILTRLLADPQAAAGLVSGVRRYTEERHNWRTCLEPFAPLLGLDDHEAATRAESQPPRPLQFARP